MRSSSAPSSRLWHEFSGQSDPFFSTGQRREAWPVFRYLSNHHRKALIMKLFNRYGFEVLLSLYVLAHIVLALIICQ
jgi:hypothetical protein